MLAVNTSIYGFIGMKIAHAPGLYPLITDCDYMLSRIHIFFSLSIDTVNGRTCMMHVYENAHIFRQTGITQHHFFPLLNHSKLLDSFRFPSITCLITYSVTLYDTEVQLAI